MESDDRVSGPSRDYLAEPRMATRADVLVQHLQAQPYIHRVRAGHSALEDVDDDDDNNDKDEQSSDLSITSWDSEEEERRARQEWEENIQQLNLALQVMLLPFFGKWLGRKWSYWAFTRYQKHGLSATYFGLDWFWAPTTEISGAAVAALQP